jgi:hypothetical protein
MGSRTSRGARFQWLVPEAFGPTLAWAIVGAAAMLAISLWLASPGWQDLAWGSLSTLLLAYAIPLMPESERWFRSRTDSQA